MTEVEPDGWVVEVTHPLRTDPEDAAWLRAAAARHRGTPSFLREIHPARQDVHFASAVDAEVFTDEVRASPRWTAGPVRRSR